MQLPAGFADFHNGFSFEAWVFPTSVAGNQPIFDFGNGYNSDNIVLAREGTSNNLIFQVFSGGVPGPVVRATGALDLNVWQQFAVTEDASGNVILYKNGQVIGSGTTNVPQNISRADNYLGKSNLDNPFFAGGLDEAAVYNAVLPAARILDHFNHASFGTVDIDLLRDGDPNFVQHLAVDAVDNGSFTWTIPANQPLANDYRIRIEASAGIMPQFTTPEPFLITNSGHDYYVNDNSKAGDVYTTAVGNNANSGKSPDQPVASLPALLTAYSFGPGDVIHVDTGTYDLITNVRLLPSDSGVTIVGPTTGTGTAVFNRGNANSGAFTFELAGATDVTLDHLGITGGYAGVEANDTGSQRLTVSNSEIFGNTDFGIQLYGYTLTDAHIIDNRVHDNGGYAGIFAGSGAGFVITGNTAYNNNGTGIQASAGTDIAGYTVTGNTAYGNRDGINASGSGTLVADNTTYDNSEAGIIVGYQTVAQGNTVFGQLGSGSYGIDVSGGEASDNIVFDNNNGIVGGGTFTSNRIFDNIASGLSTGGNSTVVGNQIYDNAIGLQGSASGGGSFTNNLIYANTTLGVGIHGTYGFLFANNTVYQLTGDALAVDSGASSVQIKNNILWAQAGHDITVSADSSELNLESDFNDLYTTGSGILGQWEGHDFTSLADWFFQLGLDGHSIDVDPQFQNPAGADGVLGYSTATIGPAQIFDDSDPSFQTAGSWTTVSGSGVGGSEHQSGGNASDTATWTLSGLTPGEEYQIAVTWPVSSFSGPTRYAVLNNGATSGFIEVNQTSAPADFIDAGAPWKNIGTFTASTSTLVLTEIDISYVHPFVADAVRVQGIQGDMGADDNFHVQTSSPTIDAGDPTSYSLSEPAPSGGRINLGSDGNTPEATLSPVQSVQVLSPNGLEKLQVGQQVPIQFRSAGLTESRPVALINVDGGVVGDFLADGYQTPLYKPGEGSLTFLDPVDTSHVTDPAPQAVYQSMAYATNGYDRLSYALPVPDGTYTIRLDFAESQVNSVGYRLFDIRLQGQTVQSSYDVVAAAGAWHTATALSFTVTATGGTGILLELVSVRQQAILSGIELTHVNASSVAAPTASLALSLDSGQTWQPLASGLALDTSGNGTYLWTPTVQTVGNTALIRVTADQGTRPQAVSINPFLITNNGHDYYVNDDASTGDVFTTAVGNNGNSGKTPDQPVASLRVVLADYTFQKGDVIHVDTGTYRTYRNIVVTGQDSGVLIQGPTTSVALLNRTSTNLGTSVFSVMGASDVTLDHLTIEGAVYGVLAPAGANSLRLTVSDDDLTLNSASGIFIDVSNADARVIANSIHDNGGTYFPTDSGITINAARGSVSGNDVFGNPNGIIATYRNGAIDQITVSGNLVRNNSRSGIYASGDVLVTGNTVFGQSAAGAIGILVSNPTYDTTDVTQNAVHDNSEGIVTDGSGAGYNITVERNRVYHNSVDGIRVYNNVSVLANQVYSNPVGIVAAGFSGVIANNLDYANTNQALTLTANGAQIDNNDLYQPVGDAVLVDGGSQNVRLFNNIIWVLAGYDLNVSSDSQAGWKSDYNLFNKGQAASATSDSGIAPHRTLSLTGKTRPARIRTACLQTQGSWT